MLLTSYDNLSLPYLNIVPDNVGTGQTPSLFRDPRSWGLRLSRWVKVCFLPCWAAADGTNAGRTSLYTDGVLLQWMIGRCRIVSTRCMNAWWCCREILMMHQEFSDFVNCAPATSQGASLIWKVDTEVKMLWWWIPVVCLLLYLLLTFSPKFNYFAKFTYLYLAYIFLRYTFPKLQIKYLSRTNLTAWSSWSFCFHDLETHQMGSWRPEYCGWLATLWVRCWDTYTKV